MIKRWPRDSRKKGRSDERPKDGIKSPGAKSLDGYVVSPERPSSVEATSHSVSVALVFAMDETNSGQGLYDCMINQKVVRVVIRFLTSQRR